MMHKRDFLKYCAPIEIMCAVSNALPCAHLVQDQTIYRFSMIKSLAVFYVQLKLISPYAINFLVAPVICMAYDEIFKML